MYSCDKRDEYICGFSYSTLSFSNALLMRVAKRWPIMPSLPRVPVAVHNKKNTFGCVCSKSALLGPYVLQERL